MRRINLPMRLFENLPIKRKLMLIGLVTNGVAAILISVIFGAGEWTSYRNRAVTTLSVHAGITADNAASALIFADEKAAQEVLARLGAETNIVYAALQEKSGSIVAKFEVPGRKKIPAAILAPDEHMFFLDQLVYVKNVAYSGETVGILYLQSDLQGIYWELFRKLLLIAATMILSLAFAIFLFARFQKSISDPIMNMAEAMRGVITEQNFTAQVEHHGKDEVGMLAGTFNTMLEYIRLRDAELERYRLHLEEEVMQRTARLTEAQRIAHLGNWEWDIAGNTLVWSDEIYRIFDLAPQQFGANYEAFLQTVHPEDRQFVDTHVRAALEQKHPYDIDHRIVRPDGSVRYVHEQAVVSRSEEGRAVTMHGTVQDITERKQAEEQIRTLAFYDALTQLPNRRLLNDRLEQTMAASKRSAHYGALMFLDLDNFKPLNDTYGHNVGDLLLIEVAHRLTSCVREVDTVARFGGDEFVVMLGELDTDQAESTAQAGIIAEKIRTTLAEPYLWACKQESNVEAIIEHHCASSIGVALFIDHEASPEDILKWADMAMYQAKEAGRNRIHFHSA